MERFLNNILDFDDTEAFLDTPPMPARLSGVHWRPVAFRGHNDALPGDVVTKLCHEVLVEMTKRKLDLKTYLRYVTSWTLPEAVADADLRSARTGLMKSEELFHLLRAWYRPPRRHNAGVRTTAAKDTLEAFALETVQRMINDEMRALAPILKSPAEDLSEESLLFDIEQKTADIKATAPTFFSILHSACYTPLQQQRNKLKNPEPLIALTIANASFMRPHHRNTFQKLFAVYFHACGISERGLDTCSALGITMSQQWTYQALDRLSTKAQNTLREEIQRYAWDAGHDNLNIARKKYEQRLDNQKMFDSGTVGAIFVHKAPDAFIPERAAYATKYAAGFKDPITAFTIFELDADTAPRLKPFVVYFVLKALKDAAPFSFNTYDYNNSDIFLRPGAIDPLPSGKEYATTHRLLRGIHVDEASYEGNISCFQEWYKQLGVTTEESRKELLSRVLPWKGDQLTVSRIRGIQGFRSQDLNAWDRWEHLPPAVRLVTRADEHHRVDPHAVLRHFRRFGTQARIQHPQAQGIGVALYSGQLLSDAQGGIASHSGSATA